MHVTPEQRLAESIRELTELNLQSARNVRQMRSLMNPEIAQKMVDAIKAPEIGPVFYERILDWFEETGG